MLQSRSNSSWGWIWIHSIIPTEDTKLTSRSDHHCTSLEGVVRQVLHSPSLTAPTPLSYWVSRKSLANSFAILLLLLLYPTRAGRSLHFRSETAVWVSSHHRFYFPPTPRCYHPSYSSHFPLLFLPTSCCFGRSFPNLCRPTSRAR
jgi:hypothetical protein